MDKFNIGDRVKLTEDYRGFSFHAKKDSLGTVISIEKFEVSVQFDDYCNGHASGGKGKYGYCLYIPPEMLRLTNKIYNVGDRVATTTGGIGSVTKDIKGTIITPARGDGHYGSSIGYVGVEFDVNINGHSCDGKGKDGYCYFVDLDHIMKLHEDKCVSKRECDNLLLVYREYWKFTGIDCETIGRLLDMLDRRMKICHILSEQSGVDVLRFSEAASLVVKLNKPNQCFYDILKTLGIDAK